MTKFESRNASLLSQIESQRAALEAAEKAAQEQIERNERFQEIAKRIRAAVQDSLDGFLGIDDLQAWTEGDFGILAVKAKDGEIEVAWEEEGKKVPVPIMNRLPNAGQARPRVERIPGTKVYKGIEFHIAQVGSSWNLYSNGEKSGEFASPSAAAKFVTGWGTCDGNAFFNLK